MDCKIISIFAYFYFAHAVGASSWGYETNNGPDTWGQDYPMCDSGTAQSPIDLNPEQALEKGNKIDEGNASISFSNNWWTTDADGELFNNGHTLEFKVDLTTNNYNFTGGPFGNETYQFLQLHFHWGSNDSQGSEHTIRGNRFPMEMHMVCINTKYINDDGTLDGDYLENKDGVAVLGFLFKARQGTWRKQPALRNIVDGISELGAESRSDEQHSIPIQVGLGSFIDQAAKGGYFTYFGSFTTPGCNEVVTWVNFKKLLRVSKGQMRTFRTLKDEEGNKLLDNFRPVQGLNERNVGFTGDTRGSWLNSP